LCTCEHLFTTIIIQGLIISYFPNYLYFRIAKGCNYDVLAHISFPSWSKLINSTFVNYVILELDNLNCSMGCRVSIILHLQPNRLTHTRLHCSNLIKPSINEIEFSYYMGHSPWKLKVIILWYSWVLTLSINIWSRVPTIQACDLVET
jgi:hypothetical protein